MKAGTESSIKFKRLKRRLSLPHWQVVGLLESLWSVTRQSAPRGDIGRFADEDIAASIEWDGDESELIATLVECGFLDRCGTHRLVVHDWADHCPTYIKGNLKNKGETFAVSDLVPHYSPRLSPPTKSPHSVPDYSPPLPSQVKSSQTKSSQTNTITCPPTANGATYPDDFLAFYTCYPRKAAKKRALDAWKRAVRIVSVERSISLDEAKLFLARSAAEFAESPRGKESTREKLPHPASFLNAGMYDDDRVEWQTVFKDDEPAKPTGNGARSEFSIPMPPPVDDSPPFPPE